MSWIQNITLIFIVSLVCYFLLIVADWSVDIISSGFRHEITSEATAMVEQRAAQDVLLKEKAISSGFNALIYPEVMESTWIMRAKMRDLNIGVVAGMPMAKTYTCNEGYGLTSYTSDRFGLRNNDEKWDHAVDTISIGDSFVHGACVDDLATIPSQYESSTNENTLNLGMGSNHPKHYLTLAKLFIPKTNPKNVFLVFYANDRGIFPSISHEIFSGKNPLIFSKNKNELALSEEYKDLLTELNDYFLSNLKIEPFNFFESAVLSLKYRLALPSIRALVLSNLKKDAIDDSKRAIKYTKEICERAGCNLKIIYIPNSKFWMPDAFSEKYMKRLQEISKELELYFIDASSVLNRKKGSLDYAINGPHLSPLGYKKVSDLIIGSPN